MTCLADPNQPLLRFGLLLLSDRRVLLLSVPTFEDPDLEDEVVFFLLGFGEGERL